MFDKRSFFRKFKNNKIWVFVISVIVVSVVYYGIDRAIDSYNFKNNSDIVEMEEEVDMSDSNVKEDKNWFENLFGNDDEVDDGSDEETSNGSSGVGDDEGGNSESDENVAGDESEVSSENVLDGENVGNEGTTENNEKPEITGSSSKEKIYIYITGEVNVPGVVILNEGSRIVDAINSAGGTTANANISKVNLVYVLEDGMKINIPNNSDLKNNPDFEYITKNSGDGANDYNSGGAGAANDSNSGGGAGSNGGSSNNFGSNVGRYDIVNINTATQTELESLPGIGPSLALKIISYRKENGKFSSIEEIKNVRGIGDSKFEELKRYIRV